MNYIYSTLSAPVAYTFYVKGGGDLPSVKQKIIIKGGANVANEHFVTPQGVVTEVTDQELQLLKDHKLFKFHIEKGYIKIDSKKEIEAAIADMNGRDVSAPVVPQDYMNDEGPKPSENSKGKNNKKDK